MVQQHIKSPTTDYNTFNLNTATSEYPAKSLMLNYILYMKASVSFPPLLPIPTLPFISVLSYPTFKTYFKNGDSYQVMTQAIGQEPLLTTLYLLPTGSRIMGGKEKGQHHLGQGNPG
jgi:hypothetical protein